MRSAMRPISDYQRDMDMDGNPEDVLVESLILQSG